MVLIIIIDGRLNATGDMPLLSELGSWPYVRSLCVNATDAADDQDRFFPGDKPGLPQSGVVEFDAAGPEVSAPVLELRAESLYALPEVGGFIVGESMLIIMCFHVRM